MKTPMGNFITGGEVPVRGYAAILTGTVASMIGFDVCWNVTQKPLEWCLATSFFVGLFVAIGFIALTDVIADQKKPVKKSKPERTAKFVDLENGLSVMIQGRRTA